MHLYPLIDRIENSELRSAWFAVIEQQGEHPGTNVLSIAEALDYHIASGMMGVNGGQESIRALLAPILASGAFDRIVQAIVIGAPGILAQQATQGYLLHNVVLPAFYGQMPDLTALTMNVRNDILVIVFTLVISAALDAAIRRVAASGGASDDTEVSGDSTEATTVRSTEAGLAARSRAEPPKPDGAGEHS